MTIHTGFWIWSRGGLCTPATTELASPEHVAIWPPGIRLPPMIMLCPGSHPAGIHGRGDRAPPRKPPSRHPRAFLRKAVLAWISHPAEGRAPHARNDGIGLAGACPHLATGCSFAPDDHVMPRLAPGPYWRTHGVRPSEKTAFRVISGPSPQGLSPPLGHPAERRAPHARNDGIGLTKASPLRQPSL